MPPASSLFPMCCCSKNVKKTKNQEEENAVAVKTKHHLVVPRVALNGRIISSIKRSSRTPRDHVSITMPEEFVTARTSREQNNNQHPSMKELMRTVRIEEGLSVTPRDDHYLGQGPSTSSRPVIVDRRLASPISSTPQELDAQRLAQRERARKAVFDADGDITARSNSRSPKAGRHSLCSIATISGDQVLVLPQPPPPPTRSNYITYVPQVLLAMITISFAWLANLISYVYR